MIKGLLCSVLFTSFFVFSGYMLEAPDSALIWFLLAFSNMAIVWHMRTKEKLEKELEVVYLVAEVWCERAQAAEWELEKR